jgi:hypothetical protein
VKEVEKKKIQYHYKGVENLKCFFANSLAEAYQLGLKCGRKHPTLDLNDSGLFVKKLHYGERCLARRLNGILNH